MAPITRRQARSTTPAATTPPPTTLTTPPATTTTRTKRTLETTTRKRAREEEDSNSLYKRIPNLASRMIEMALELEDLFGCEEGEKDKECFCDSSYNYDAIYFKHDGVCPTCGNEMESEFEDDSDDSDD